MCYEGKGESISDTSQHRTSRTPDRVLSCLAPHFFVDSIVGIPLSVHCVLLVIDVLPVGERQALAFAAV